MTDYIDLHNHILPGIDDGPRTLSEAVKQARAFAIAGYSTVVATPHSLKGQPSPALIKERISELQHELKEQHISLAVLPGAEEHLEPEIPERLQAGEIVTLNDTRYLLLELPMQQPLPTYTEDLIFKLVSSGYRPIIPHPERTLALQKNRPLLYRLQQLGVIYQLTWGGLTGLLGPDARSLVHHMLKKNLAHLFATDAHNANSRLQSVFKAASIIDNKLGPNSAQTYLVTKPRLLLSGGELDLLVPKPLP